MSRNNQRNTEAQHYGRYEERDKNYRQPKQIRPVIEDDRNRTRPNYVEKEPPRPQNQKNEPKRHQRINEPNGDYHKSHDRRDEPRTRINQNLRAQQRQESNSIRNQSQERRRGYDKNYRLEFERQNYKIEEKVYPQFELIQNYVYVGRLSNLKHLILEAKQKLPNYNFIGIKAVGRQVPKAFLLAEELSKQISNLKRINIPGTVKLETIYTPKLNKKGLQTFTKTTIMASILIELSSKNLNIKHMGYQQSVQTKEKQTEGYNRAQHKKREQQKKSFPPQQQSQEKKQQRVQKYRSQKEEEQTQKRESNQPKQRNYNREVNKPNRNQYQNSRKNQNQDREERKNQRKYTDDREIKKRQDQKEERREERKAYRQQRRRQNQTQRNQSQPQRREGRQYDNREERQYNDERYYKDRSRR